MNIIKNYIYTTLYQIMAIIVPFITMPYITRIFTPEQIGMNSYSLSIVNYFILFGVLGMNMYGNRQIAYVRDNKKKLNETFWNLFYIKAITCFISIILYYIFVFSFINENRVIFIIQGIGVFCSMIDISWLYSGLEDFKTISIRNACIKLTTVILIFTIIKDENDLLKYVFISIIANLLGTLIMWINLPKNIKIISLKLDIFKVHFIPLLKLFIPQIAIQVYGLLSKTMLGSLSTTTELALYDYSQRIIQILITLISSVGVVLMPRVANIISNGNNIKVKELIYKSFSYISYISIPMALGLMATANSFIPWFLDKDFINVGNLIVMTGIIIIPVSWANIIGVQYLIASKREEKYIISIIIAAIINFLFNIILIRNFGAIGASISLILAEWIGVIIQFILVRKELNIKKMFNSVKIYLIAAIPMSIVVFSIGNLMSCSIITNIIQVIIGCVIYFGILYILKDSIQNSIINKIMTGIINKLSNFKFVNRKN